MTSRLSGTLIRVLKHSRVAWYNGIGTTAYYEQPSPGTPGALFINGQRICQLVVDREGLYADFPSPKVQRMMTERGVRLDRGWTCAVEIYGLPLNDAVLQSRFLAARHHNERVCIQCIDQQRSAIFVDGIWRWTIKNEDASRALVELELSTHDGWYPLQQDLFRRQRCTG